MKTCQGFFSMKRMTTAALAVALALSLSLGARLADAANESDVATNDKNANKLYWDAQASLKKGDWSAALKEFGDLEKMLRAKEPASADAAIYWEAYTLAQAKRTAEAKAQVERLRREFPKSRWLADADALTREASPPTSKSHGEAHDDDEDLADIAVEGLMSAPPERALPILKKVLQGSQPTKIKKRALFVLSQLGTDAALDVVIDTAKSSQDPDLRAEAIRMLGVSGEPRGIEGLRGIYASSKDDREKRTIIEAWLVADRKDLVLASARNEPSPDVRRKAIETLGVLDGGAELGELFKTTTDAANRHAIIQALGVAGATDALERIASDTKLPDDVRAEATQSLGVAGDGGKLEQLYRASTTDAMRSAALNGLVVSGDSDRVLSLYRSAKTVDEKKRLLRTLTVMGDDDHAIEAIEAELGGDGGKP
jgi:HEAT repeat protein